MIHGVLKHNRTSPSLPALLTGYSEESTGRALLKTAAENGLEPGNVKGTERDRVTKEQEEQVSCARGESTSNTAEFFPPLGENFSIKS